MLSVRMVSLMASRLGTLPKSELSSTWSFIVSAKRNSSRDANRAWTGLSHSQTGRTSAHGEKVSLGTLEDEAPDMEDVDEKIQAVLSEERQRRRKLKYHIIKRQMSEPGAPERKLTWETMEQIRYLKRELPEEWTIDRLAEGFSVHRDVILRVLKSRFTPTPERRAKQDTRVWARLRQQALDWDGAPGGQCREQLAGGTAGKGMQLIAAGGTAGKGMQLAGAGGTAGKGMQLAGAGGTAGKGMQLIAGGGTTGKGMQLAGAGGTVGTGMQLIAGGGTAGKGMQLAGAGGTTGKGMQLAGAGEAGGLHSDTPATLPTDSGTGALISLSGQSLRAQEYSSQLYMSPTLHSRHTSVPRRSREEEERAPEHIMSEEIQEDVWLEEERWDGRVFSEDELEKLLSTKPLPVVQKGMEFFDNDGNFLYRI